MLLVCIKVNLLDWFIRLPHLYQHLRLMRLSKKNRLHATVIFLSIFLCNSPVLASFHNPLFAPKTDMTSLVLKRFYTIARLKKACTTFFSVLPDYRKLVSLIPSFIQSAFVTPTHPSVSMLTEILPLLKHPHIRLHIEIAHATSSLEPVGKLWKEICAYRFLGDDLFIDEFCQVLYLLFQQGNKNKKKQYDDVINSCNATNRLSQSLTASDALAITKRFYLIQRLQHAVTACIDIYGSQDDLAFTIMLALWDDIQQYKNIDKPIASFNICSSLISLLDPPIHRLKISEHARIAAEATTTNPSQAADSSDLPTSQTAHHGTSVDHILFTFGSSNSSGNSDHEVLEKLLEYIDAITDNYHYKTKSTMSF